MTAAHTHPFFYDQAQLSSVTHQLIDMARRAGATDAAAEVSEHAGLSVQVRLGQLETLERTRDRGASLTVYKGLRRGHATSSDLSEPALNDMVARALDLASYTAEDPFAGLPEADDLALQFESPDLFFPWSVTAEEAAELALAAESAARSTSPLIRNSEGAGVWASHGQFFMANSRGFAGGYPYSRHSLSVAPIAQRGQAMQRDDWSTSHRDPTRLADPAAVGRYAAERALSRLGARAIPTGEYPVLFEAPLAAGLMGSLVHALSGSALYRKASFLNDSMGQQILPDWISLEEDPSLPQANGSAPFDDEGCRVAARRVIESGRVNGYFLSTYTARKLGMRTTGNAGGAHNLRLISQQTRSTDDLPALLQRMGRGLFVTELMGQGVNGLTGDYSRGAFGYWVEGGQIQHPVEEITIASNLKDMFRSVVAVGADEMNRGTKTTGSILIEKMMVAGC